MSASFAMLKEIAAELTAEKDAIITELVAALRELIEHCDNMEAQHPDYHGIGDMPGPIRSQPLCNASNVLAKIESRS